MFAVNNIKFKTLIDRGVHQLLYTYDMGDNWEHVVTVEAIKAGTPDTNYARYIEASTPGSARRLRRHTRTRELSRRHRQAREPRSKGRGQ
jgi:hypothetical protein